MGILRTNASGGGRILTLENEVKIVQAKYNNLLAGLEDSFLTMGIFTQYYASNKFPSWPSQQEFNPEYWKIVRGGNSGATILEMECLQAHSVILASGYFQTSATTGSNDTLKLSLFYRDYNVGNKYVLSPSESSYNRLWFAFAQHIKDL